MRFSFCEPKNNFGYYTRKFKKGNFLGADGRNRTGDLRFTKALLYQLSYIGIMKCENAGAKTVIDTITA